MSNVARVLIELRRQRYQTQQELERLEEAIATLSSLVGRKRIRVGKSVTRPKRRMSAAARRRIVAAQKARWAKWRAEHKKAA